MIELRCPQCKRFLAEVEGKERVRVRCRDCANSVTYEPRPMVLDDWRGLVRN